jgi:Flp pilus assembly protein TadG
MFTTARRHSRRGAIAVVVAVCLVVVLIFVAIATDGGRLLDRRCETKAVADAAALAAAENLFRTFPQYQGVDGDGSAANAAYAVAAANGFSNDSTPSLVEVRTAPQTYAGGPNAGKQLPSGYVEVNIQHDQRRFFSAILGNDRIPVRARAVARGVWEPSEVAIHVLDLHASPALTCTGESFITVRGASVIINSDAPDAATSTGGIISAPSIQVTGGTSVSGTKGGFYGDIHYGVPPAPDPLRHIPEPNINGLSVQSHGKVTIAHGTRTLQPGTYRGGITVTGLGSLSLEPGIYYMDGGGFDFSGQGNLNAQGVMIFNGPKLSSDTVSITGTGSIIMSPPQDGTYTGLTLFQDRESTNTMTVSGGGYMYISGTFYTANGLLQVGGNGNSKVGSQYISRLLDVVGTGGLLIEYSKNEAIPRRVLHLVE